MIEACQGWSCDNGIFSVKGEAMHFKFKSNELHSSIHDIHFSDIT